MVPLELGYHIVGDGERLRAIRVRSTPPRVFGWSFAPVYAPYVTDDCGLAPIALRAVGTVDNGIEVALLYP